MMGRRNGNAFPTQWSPNSWLPGAAPLGYCPIKARGPAWCVQSKDGGKRSWLQAAAAAWCVTGSSCLCVMPSIVSSPRGPGTPV